MSVYYSNNLYYRGHYFNVKLISFAICDLLAYNRQHNFEVFVCVCACARARACVCVCMCKLYIVAFEFIFRSEIPKIQIFG